MRRFVSGWAVVGLAFGIAGCGGGGIQPGMVENPPAKTPEPPAAVKPAVYATTKSASPGQPQAAEKPGNYRK